MTKVDFKKELRQLYKPSPKEVVVVDVPEMNLLMIDGVGDPNTAQEYKDAIEALYSVSYALKFMVKKGESAIDYAVMPLEGLWWVDDMPQFSMENKDAWKWTAMIMQPEYVTEGLVNEALRQVEKKKNPPALSKIRFESFHEGLSAQIMHIGPYSAEGPTIERLHNFIKENGYELRGRHHEIYLSDPRRSAPEKMRTVIRQPMQ
ncbi:MAG: GyrI-like domain-containing protein [Anaerolineae bacterium]